MQDIYYFSYTNFHKRIKRFSRRLSLQNESSLQGTSEGLCLHQLLLLLPTECSQNSWRKKNKSGFLWYCFITEFHCLWNFGREPKEFISKDITETPTKLPQWKSLFWIPEIKYCNHYCFYFSVTASYSKNVETINFDHLTSTLQI